MLARSMDVDVGTVQLSPLQGLSPLLLQDEEEVLVTAASFIDARRDSSWHSHLFHGTKLVSHYEIEEHL